MTDFISVKPLRTFDNGSGIKTAESAPFDVERGEANELKAAGLVSFVGGDAKAEPDPTPKPVVEPVVETPKKAKP